MNGHSAGSKTQFVAAQLNIPVVVVVIVVAAAAAQINADQFSEHGSKGGKAAL
jgi:hypothetical protein